MLMWNTYLIGDLRLYDRTQSLPLGLSLEGYNKYIIKRVNQFVQDDNDIIILVGDISHGTLEQTVDVLTQFNGTIYLMSTQFQEFLNDITLKPYNNKIKTLWGISDFQDSKIGNEISRIVITADAQQIYQLQFVDNTYIAAPSSVVKMEGLYENRILNISIDKWDFIPIELGTQLPQIIDDMELRLLIEKNKNTIENEITF